MSARLTTDLPKELLDHMQRIKQRAIDYGLNFYEVVFERLDFATMNQIAAYGGFPTRYPHWRWGMEYDKLAKRDAYGLGRIYEMVINTDPCYAYLQESNSVTDQKLVMAHVYGHADFFKHNFWFSKTNRKMMDEMANHATRVRRHIDRRGQDTVERFLDLCHSVDHLIDPHSIFVKRGPSQLPDTEIDDGEFHPDRYAAKEYMDPFINPASDVERQKKEFEDKRRQSSGRIPLEPTRDLLMFLMQYGQLAEWQRDILALIRDEAYYFAPQGMTKIMNEGWATYWHSKLMTQHFLESSEIVDYADQHSGVVHMPPGGFNPYKIGVELFKDIERRWDRGQHGPQWESLQGLGEREAVDHKHGKGREKIFEVRRIYNDVSFIDEFLTPEFVERYNMYQYRRDPQTGEARIVTRDFGAVKQTMLHFLTNSGQPFVYVVDGNYLNRGELFLAHKYIGVEVDAAKAVEVLRNIRMLWGRPVHLQMRVNDDMVVLSIHDPGDRPKREKITDDTPAPAHIMA
jgi:stage V sporulation protein R